MLSDTGHGGHWQRPAAPIASRGTRLRQWWKDWTAVRVQSVDVPMVWAIGALLLLGLVMVYSASIAVPERKGFVDPSPTYFLIRHAIYLCIGAAAAVFAAAMPVQAWQRAAMPAFLFTIVLLVLVFVPGIGKNVNGANRWIMLGPVTVQPTELMKLFVILYVADYATRKNAKMHQFREGFIPMALALSLVSVLIIRETDLGALVVISVVAMLMLFLGGMSPRLFLGLILSMAVMFALFVLFEPFRFRRLVAYLDPFDTANRQAAAFQLTHSLMAIGKGEFFGEGLGAGVVKLSHLPEPHTDFLFAIIGEELGLVGMLVVVALFLFVVRRCFIIGREAMAFDQIFSGLVAQGVGIWIGLQAFINIGVNIGLLPTKGLTLPLMSYGGSAIIMNCIALAIVLRIDFENRRQTRGRRLA